jgi:elongation factor 1-alpha
MIKIPPKALDKPFRMPVSDILKIKGVGDVITGRIEQGTIVPGTEVRFIPTDTESTPCIGKVFSIEMHHKSVDKAVHGDNIGMSIKGLDKSNMPKAGDIMIFKNDKTLSKCKKFVAQIQVLEHPGELKVGYSPIVHCRTAKTACRMTAIRWRKGKLMVSSRIILVISNLMIWLK